MVQVTYMILDKEGFCVASGTVNSVEAAHKEAQRSAEYEREPVTCIMTAVSIIQPKAE
jgi:hypothetical protein